MKAKVTLHICDLTHFYETSEKYGFTSVSLEYKRWGHLVTIECDRPTLELYLEEEYCLGMDHETIKETFDAIEDL